MLLASNCCASTTYGAWTVRKDPHGRRIATTFIPKFDLPEALEVFLGHQACLLTSGLLVPGRLPKK